MWGQLKGRSDIRQLVEESVEKRKAAQQRRRKLFVAAALVPYMNGPSINTF